MKTIRVGLVSNEFFDCRLGRMGGFGQAARRTAECFNGDPSLGVEVVFLTGAQVALPNGKTPTVHGTRMIRHRRRRPMDSIRLWRERIDLLMTIDYRPNYRTFFRAFPRTPILVWVRDPRTPDDVAHVETLTIPNSEGATPQGIAPIDCTSLNDVVCESKRIGRDVVIATAAPYLDDHIGATYGVQDCQPVFLPTVVDIEFDGCRKSRRPTVVYLGRLDPIKRPWLFIELARRKPDFEFLVMGLSNFHGSGSWQPKSLPSNVRMLGHLDDEERDERLRAAWILVNTSVHESLSSSFLEALACEMPIVSCLNPGEVVSRFGRFAGRWDGDGLDGAPALADAIQELVDDNDLRTRLGGEGRRWVRDTYNRPNFLAVFGDICRDLGLRR